MPARRHFDPDHYLETDEGRLFTKERNAVAWERAYSELEGALQGSNDDAKLYVVIGVQGAGKSRWIEANAQRLGQNAYFFDAALPKAKHRERVLAIAKSSDVPVVAVWINVPLEVALARNQCRRSDHRVPEDAVRSVFAMMEPPSPWEGYIEIIEVAYECERG